MADAFDQFQILIRENMGNASHNLTIPEVDDIAIRLMNSAEPLGLGGRTQGSTGAYSGASGYEARRKVKLQRGGMVQGSGWAGNTLTMMGANSDTPVGQAADALAPDPTKVPLAQYKELYESLKRVQGNLVVNHSQIMNDLIGDSIEDVAADFIEDGQYQVRTNCCAWLYGDGSGSLGQCANTEGALSGQHTIELKTGTFSRFIKGQQYVFADDSAGWPTTKTQLGGVARCVNVDGHNRTVQFEMEPGEAAPTLAVDDHILLKGSVDFATNASLVHNGFESMIVESGTLHGLNVATYVELKGKVSGDESNFEQPTPDLIDKSIDYITDMREQAPNVLISERSVQSNYAQLEKAGYATYNVPESGGTTYGGGVNAGEDGGATYHHGTRTFTWYVSSFVRPNSIIGIAPDTFMRFQPMGSDTIRWRYGNGGMAGANGIFGPVYVGSQLSELLQAPFETHAEFMCVRPRRNFRILGVHNQRGS